MAKSKEFEKNTKVRLKQRVKDFHSVGLGQDWYDRHKKFIATVVEPITMCLNCGIIFEGIAENCNSLNLWYIEHKYLVKVKET